MSLIPPITLPFLNSLSKSLYHSSPFKISIIIFLSLFTVFKSLSFSISSFPFLLYHSLSFSFSIFLYPYLFHSFSLLFSSFLFICLSFFLSASLSSFFSLHLSICLSIYIYYLFFNSVIHNIQYTLDIHILY